MSETLKIKSAPINDAGEVSFDPVSFDPVSDSLGSPLLRGPPHVTSSVASGDLNQQPFFAYCLLALGAFAVNAIFIAGGLGILGNKYTTPDSTLSAEGAQVGHIMDVRETWAIGFVLAGAFAGPALIGWLLIASVQQMAGRPKTCLYICCALTAISAAIAVWAWIDLIVSWDTFNVIERFDDTQPGGNKPDTLKQFLGGLIFCTFSLLTLAALGVCVNLVPGAVQGLKNPNAANSIFSYICHGLKRSKTPPSDFQPTHIKSNWKGMAGLSLTLLGSFAATTVLTCVWNFSAGSYFQYVSSFSMNAPFAITWGAPPVDDFHVQPIVQVKVYTDCVVYFSTVGALALLGAIGTYSPVLRRLLHSRFDVRMRECAGRKETQSVKNNRRPEPILESLVNYFLPEGVTLGEVIVLGVGIFLYAYWLWFFGGWPGGYPRLVQEVQGYNDAFPNMHVFARVFGHLTTLTMSFLSFPVARNSVWESVFGVPFDRAIKYHRALGTLCWLLVTTHMLLYQIKWLREGVLLANVLTTNRLQTTACSSAGYLCVINASGAFGPFDEPTNGTVPCPCVFSALEPGPSGQPQVSSVLPNSAHFDNFTVPVAETAWLLLTVSLIVAIWMRRHNYEAFQYTHYAVWFFYAAGLIHAWSHWYYTAGGLILLGLDKVFRTVDAARPVRVKSLLSAHGVTRVVLDASFLRGRPFYAGQYMWLNIPAVSGVEWHPFTISSPPSESLVFGNEDRTPTISFHIRDMGEGTWTSRLADVAGSPEETHASLAVSVDGPHGRMGDFADRDTVIMCAGGIGITPFASICSEILARSSDPAHGSLPKSLRRVILVWAVRDIDLISVFADQVAPLIKPPPQCSVEFTVHIYLTRQAEAADPLSPYHTAHENARPAHDSELRGEAAAALCRSIIKSGRPPIEDIIHSATESSQKYLAAKGSDGDLLSCVSSERSTIAMVCGPQELSKQVSNAAFSSRTGFHSEVFTF